MIAGIVGVAAGLHDAIAGAGHGPPDPHSPEALSSWVLAFGAALYLLSDKWFRRSLAFDTSHWRGAAAIAAILTLPIGLHVSSAVQIGTLVGVFVAMLVIEHYWQRM